MQVFGDRLHVWMTGNDATAEERRLTSVASDAAIGATHIRRIVPSLEDVFISKVVNRKPS